MAIIYVGPASSGNRSGVSADHAMGIASLNDAIKKAGPGGEVRLIADAGVFHVKAAINIYAGGSDGASVTVRSWTKSGLDTAAQFEGTRNPVYAEGQPAGNELFKLMLGARNLTFKNIDVANTGTVFRAGADTANIAIDNVDAKNVARYFENYASGNNLTATISGLDIRNAEIEGFSKGVVRLKYGTHDVTIENVRGDSAGQNGDEFAIGVHLDDAVHDVRIVRTVMENAQNTSGRYWNGDGFATERGVTNLQFEDTVSRGNSDGGYDLKSTATTLVRAIAEDNGKNFRIWGEVTLIDPVGLNPHVRGGHSGQVQIQVLEGAIARVTGGIFTDAGSKTVVFDVDGTLSIANTQTVYAANARLSVGNTDDGIAFGNVRTVTSVGEFSHRYTPPPADTAPPAIVKIVDLVPPGVTTHVATFDSSFTGSAGQDRIKIDIDARTGLTKIAAFGADDLVLLSKALRDSNNDNIVGVGSNARFNEADGDSLAIAGVKSLRYLGIVDGAHAYADLADRPKGAIEGTSASNIFKADATGAQADTFFFDTALDIGLGRDRISSFAASDRIVVTERLVADADGVVRAGSDGFALNADVAGSTDSLSITDLSGQSVSALALVGQQTTAGIVFYTYAAVAGAYLI